MWTRAHTAFTAFVAGVAMTTGLRAQTGKPTTSSTTTATEPLYKFATDFDVPESPGFATLGVTPSKVLRGSIAKPVVTSLLGQVTGGGKLKGGVAVDVAPYFLYGGKVNNVEAYRANPIRRALANTQLSFATAQDQKDTASLLFGLGLRMVFLDAHDVLIHRGVLERVDSALVSCSRGPVVTGIEASAPGSGVGKEHVCAGLADSMQSAKDAALSYSGWSLAAGAGLGGFLHSSVVSSDSLGDRRGRIWLSAGYSWGRHQEILMIAQAQDSATVDWSARVGVGARAKFTSAEIGFELSYDGRSKEFQPGGAAEWRVVPGVWLVGGLTTEAATVNRTTVPKLKLRTSLRWNPAGSNLQ
jgi:hypothetical protein